MKGRLLTPVVLLFAISTLALAQNQNMAPPRDQMSPRSQLRQLLQPLNPLPAPVCRRAILY